MQTQRQSTEKKAVITLTNARLNAILSLARLVPLSTRLDSEEKRGNESIKGTDDY